MENLERYAVDQLGLMKANFYKVEEDIVQEILSVIEEAFYLYPTLRNSFIAIEQSPIKQFDMCIMSLPFRQDKVKLVLSQQIRNVKLEELNKNMKEAAKKHFHPEELSVFRGSIWHEMGHVFDNVFEVTKDRKFHHLMIQNKAFIKNGFSRYALSFEKKEKKDKELFAEFFAAYHMREHPRKQVEDVMDFAYQKYDDYLLYDYFSKIEMENVKVLKKERKEEGLCLSMK